MTLAIKSKDISIPEMVEKSLCDLGILDFLKAELTIHKKAPIMCFN